MRINLSSLKDSSMRFFLTYNRPRSSMRRFILLSSLLFSDAVSASTCYWPSGKVAADNWLQCPGSTHCCAEGEACLSNGLCVAGTYMTVYRGACTEKSWPISECPRVCYEEVADGWANLYPCPSNNNEVFTCGTGGWASHVCDQQLGNYTWVSSNVTVAQLGVSTTSSSAMTSATSSGTSSTTSPQSTGSSTSNSGANCTASAGNDATMKTGLRVGVGLGVPLLLALAGLLWLYVRTRRRIQSLQQRLNEQRAVYPGPRGHYARAPIQELDAGKENMPEIQSNYCSELS